MGKGTELSNGQDRVSEIQLLRRRYAIAMENDFPRELRNRGMEDNGERHTRKGDDT